MEDLLRVSWGSPECDTVSSNSLVMFVSDDPADTRANPVCLVCFLSLWNEPGRWDIYISNSMLQTPSGIADRWAVGRHHLFCFCFLDAIVVPRHRDNRLYVANDIRFSRASCIVAKLVWLDLSTQAYVQALEKQSTCELPDIACLWREFA